jgi:hypothetical protein
MTTAGSGGIGGDAYRLLGIRRPNGFDSANRVQSKQHTVYISESIHQVETNSRVTHDKIYNCSIEGFIRPTTCKRRLVLFIT